MKGMIKSGSFVGTGATVNVELGWVPNSVELYNASDGTPLQIAYLIPWAVPFSSGGTTAIVAGSTIRGLTSGAVATVDSVQIASGSFAAGTAAGFLNLVEGTLVGTFGAENIVVTNTGSALGTDDATVTANVIYNCAVTTAAAAVLAGTSAISRYEGATASTGKGFTVGSALAVAAKRINWRAFRDDA